MHSLADLVGKPVVDGSGKEIAIVDGLNITLVDYRIYLRITGPAMENIRGRREEFVPLAEVNDIGEDAITLYKDAPGIAKTIRGLDMENRDSYRLRELIGMPVVDFDDKTIGTVKNVGVSEEGRKPYYVIAGERIEKIRGRDEELLPFIEVDSIQDTVKIDLSYDTLSRKIKERSIRGPW